MSFLGYVYFVGHLVEGPIKVGHTRGAPEARLAAIQTYCPFDLVLHGTISGHAGHEQEIHELLSDYAIRGEWFERDGALQMFDALDHPLIPIDQFLLAVKEGDIDWRHFKWRMGMVERQQGCWTNMRDFVEQYG